MPNIPFRNCKHETVPILTEINLVGLTGFSPSDLSLGYFSFFYVQFFGLPKVSQVSMFIYICKMPLSFISRVRIRSCTGCHGS